jgi:HYR domain
VQSAYGIAVDRLGNVYISSGTDAILLYAPTSGNTPPPDTTPPTFPIGTTVVTCTATDKAGNTAKATFTVTVKDTTPPDTTITSVADGNNRAITNGGSILYHSIQLTFTGSDRVGIAGFQCSLDGQAASSCTSPVTFNNLAVGTHTFEVRAIDTSNNIDQTPASFTWTILTPSQYTQQLTRNLVNWYNERWKW